MIETNYTIEKPLAKNNKRCYDFNITVMDKYTADCEKAKCTGCTGRTINEIYQDTEDLLFSALNFLSGLVEATLPDGSTGFYNQDMLNAWVSAGYIPDYTPGFALGSILEQNVKNATAYRAGIPAENLYGNSITLTMCLNACETTEYNFHNPDFVEISRQSGCTTCG